MATLGWRSVKEFYFYMFRKFQNQLFLIFRVTKWKWLNFVIIPFSRQQSYLQLRRLRKKWNKNFNVIEMFTNLFLLLFCVYSWHVLVYILYALEVLKILVVTTVCLRSTVCPVSSYLNLYSNSLYKLG